MDRDRINSHQLNPQKKKNNGTGPELSQPRRRAAGQATAAAMSLRKVIALSCKPFTLQPMDVGVQVPQLLGQSSLAHFKHHFYGQHPVVFKKSVAGRTEQWQDPDYLQSLAGHRARLRAEYGTG